MTSSKKTTTAPALRSKDEGGASTRDCLLDVAGQIFAEKGFDRTTSKEITERAGTNIAAVNYHFQGIEGLYAAVLEEAGKILVSSDIMKAAVEGPLDGKAKLKAYLTPFVQVLLSPAASSWRLRVLVREFASPSVAKRSQRDLDRLKKMQILKGIVGEIMRLPEEHPAVSRGCVSVMAPCAVLLLFDRDMLKRAYPQFGLKPDDGPPLIDHLMQFSMAGLAAVAAEVTQMKDGTCDPK